MKTDHAAGLASHSKGGKRGMATVVSGSGGEEERAEGYFNPLHVPPT
jgi:hypothetical protein